MNEITKLKCEVWKSDNNQEEVHLFLPNERNTYVIGYNPNLIDQKEVQKFLKETLPAFEFITR